MRHYTRHETISTSYCLGVPATPVLTLAFTFDRSEVVYAELAGAIDLD
jgi:hypothetical protein